MEGPFAAKLKAVTEGRDFPKVSPDALAVAEGLDLSGGGKTGREKRRAKHERHERSKQGSGEGVSGNAVHTRGRFVEAEPIGETTESPELQEAKRLFGEISAQCDTLGQLNAFMEAKGYKDAEGNLAETVAARLERANQAMLPLKEGLPITSAEVDILAGLLKESDQDIADLKEALEGLESAGELALSPEIKSLFEAKSDPSPAGRVDQSESVNVEQRSAEKRPYASFNADELRALWRRQSPAERIALVEGQVKEWRTFDQTIREFKDEERFKEDLKARGLGEKYDQVLRLTGRGDGIATRLEEIRKAFEERGELDQKEAAFLTAIFFDYHELLAVAEGIAAERDRETPIVEAEKKEGELVAFLDDNYKGIIRSLKSIKTREQLDKLKAEKPDNPISGGAIDVDGLRHLFGDQYPENDDKLVEKLLRLANKFQAEIDALYKEVEQKVSAKAEKSVRAVDSENAPDKRVTFQEKVARLSDLLGQWEALEQEFGAEPLRQAVRSLRRIEKRGSVPPTGKIAQWFAEHDGPKAWQGRAAAADRALLTEDALPGMEAMVQDGRLIAEKLRKEQLSVETAAVPVAPEVERGENEPIVRGDVWEAPSKDPAHAGRRVVVTGITSEGKIEYRFYNFDEIGNAQNMGFGMHDSEQSLKEWLAAEGYAYKERREEEVGPPAASVLTLDRRPVIDGELTEWERMNPVEQNRIRRELFSRKDRFVTGLNERLKRAGVNDTDRRSTVLRYLDEYLPQVIELVIQVPLQDTDREILLRDLKKEIAIT